LVTIKEEQLLATILSSPASAWIDNAVHETDAALTTTSEAELKVWGYLMTQYNLKPGLRKFGNRGETAAVKELSQLHVMDTWTPMEAGKLS
jgi:hypothetical protein